MSRKTAIGSSVRRRAYRASPHADSDDRKPEVALTRRAELAPVVVVGGTGES
jgi:hypothetical protein